MKKTLIFAFVYSSFSLTAYAQQPRERRGPPPEAVEACQSKSEGDACSFEGRRGFVSGLCLSPPDAEWLACRPSDRPDRNER